MTRPNLKTVFKKRKADKPKANRYSEKRRKEIIEHVLAQTSSGRFISRILAEDKGMPTSSTWWLWVMNDEILSEKVVQARARGVEALLDECGEIADDGTNDYIEIERANGSKKIVVDKENVLRSRLRVETRIKLAQMLKPKTYGPKLDVTSNGQSIYDRMMEGEKRLKQMEGEGD